MNSIKPSELEQWEDIDQSKADTKNVCGHPEWYVWFKHESGIYYPHRKPTLEEVQKDEFN